MSWPADRGGKVVQDVEVITFDELYERACFLVEDQ
jgi:hypothetical protein